MVLKQFFLCDGRMILNNSFIYSVYNGMICSDIEVFYLYVDCLLIHIKYLILEHVWCPMEEVCLADSGTMNTILRETKYFQSIRKSIGSLTTIAGSDACIIGSGRATIILPMGGH